MQPIAPVLLAKPSVPNVELLRRHGWSVNCVSGSYCVAWRGRDEAAFEWRDGEWARVDGRGNSAAA